MKIIETEQEYKELLSNSKYVLIDFFADWCGPCKMLGPVLEQLAGTEKEVAFAKVNVDHNPEIAAIYGIMTIPTLIVFENGEPVTTSVGFKPLPELQKMLAEVKK